MDINRATKHDIMLLKGVGKSLMERIIKARPFFEWHDLLAVPGVTERLLKNIRAQGVFLGRPKPKPIRLKIRGDIISDEKQLIGVAFDERNRFLGCFQLDDSMYLNVTDELKGKMITVFLGPTIGLSETPSFEQMRRHHFSERRFKIPFEKTHLDFGQWEIPHYFVKRGCCRVRGKVVKRTLLPNGDTRTAPLCNARVQICEVDKSPLLAISRLPLDLLARFRLELIALGTLPTSELEQQPITIAKVEADRFNHLRAISPKVEIVEIARTLKRTKGIEASRSYLIQQLDLLKLVWCEFEWLFNQFGVDCLKTVKLDKKGRFDTHITYPCYGDKPDLYFRIEQACHDEEWKTIHAPSVSCSTRWNYCCGDKIEIVVTNPEAATGPIAGGCDFPYIEDDPASVGEWSMLPDSEVFTVHAALMNTGKVLLFSGGTETQLPLESRVWDPETGSFTAQNFSDDLFCAHQIALADGRILVNGGSNYNGPHGRGIDANYTFDPISESWTKHTDMGFGRWYPTTVMLANGRALTFSGRAADGSVVNQVENFNPGSNTWSTLAASANKLLEIYPTMHLLKNGKVFYTGCRWAGQTRAWPSPQDTAVFDPSTNAWADVGPHVITNRTEGTSVLLPPARAMSMEGHEHGEELPPPPSNQRVLVLGGVADNVANRKSAEIIDMNDASPAWKRISDMNFSRVNPNAVILPDRRVIVIGGVEGYKFDWNPGNVLTTEIFDPTSDSWTIAASMNRPRQYHSVSVLLPDGRVMATGTSSRNGNDQSMEVYSPPYLFRGPRPRMTGYPSLIQYGSSIHVDTPDACRIRDACLLRPGAPTHHTDTEQRLVPLHIMETDACKLSLMIPDNRALLPPGYYLLFILDDCEIPSVGKFILLA